MGGNDKVKEYMRRAQEERLEQHNNRVFRLLEALQRHQNFSQSQPPFSFTFVETLIRVYGEKKLRAELNKMDAWLQADPRRRKKNYRLFVVRWMNKADKPVVIKYNKDEE